MVQKKVYTLLIVICLFLLAGCGPATLPTPPISDTPLPFAKLYPLKDINKSISLELDPGIKSDLKPGANVFLQVQNLSSQQIWFDADWQIRIYQAATPQADLWKSVDNGVQYVGDGVTLDPPGGSGMTNDAIVCIPLLNDIQSATTVRVVVTGQILKNKQKTGTPVSAYTDVIINP